jgi:hypothetical protein
MQPTESADPPNETEQLIENPEPEAPAAVEDVEEVPVDSTGS